METRETDTFLSSTSPTLKKSGRVDDGERQGDTDENTEFLPEKETTNRCSEFSDNMMSTKYKVFKTLCLILGHVGMGLTLELAGPTLQDMMKRVDANYEEISRGLSSKMIGVMVMAPLTGILTDVFDQHVMLIMLIGYFISVLGTAILPWCHSLAMFIAFSTIQGFSSGIIDVCHNFVILRIWGEEAGPPLYSLHVGFGIGALIAPQLAKPFITGNTPPVVHNETGMGNTTFTIPQMNTAATISDISLEGGTDVTSKIQIPYSIAAAYVLLLTPLILVIYIYERCRFTSTDRSVSKKHEAKQDTSSFKQRFLKGLHIFSPGSCTGGKTGLGVVFFMLFFLFYLHIVGGERSYHTLLFSYAVDGAFLFSKNKAANINSVFWFSFLAGRFLSIFASIKIPAHIIMFILVSMSSASGLLLFIFGATHELVFWIATGMYAFFMAPLYPACAAWANNHVEMKGIATALMTIGAGSGATIYHWIAGYLFEYYGPYSLMKVLLTNCVIVWFSFLVLFLVAIRIGKRFTEVTEETIVSGDVETSI